MASRLLKKQMRSTKPHELHEMDVLFISCDFVDRFTALLLLTPFSATCKFTGHKLSIKG